MPTHKHDTEASDTERAEPVTFPATEQDQQLAARELDHRLNLLSEFASVVAMRANLHASLAKKHAGRWLGDWEAQRFERFSALANVLGAAEFAAMIRGNPLLRELFSRDLPSPQKRPRSMKRVRKAKPFELSDMRSWDFSGI